MKLLKNNLGVLVLNSLIVVCVIVQVNRVDELNKIDTKDYVSQQVSYEIKQQYT